MIENVTFKMSKTPAIKGKKRKDVLRYFALGVKDELEDGEDVREIFKQAADDTQSRRKALEIAGKINAAFHCGHGPTIWAARFEIE
jgi:hypothetical protein